MASTFFELCLIRHDETIDFFPLFFMLILIPDIIAFISDYVTETDVSVLEDLCLVCIVDDDIAKSSLLLCFYFMILLSEF